MLDRAEPAARDTVAKILKLKFELNILIFLHYKSMIYLFPIIKY